MQTTDINGPTVMDFSKNSAKYVFFSCLLRFEIYFGKADIRLIIGIESCSYCIPKNLFQF